MSDTPSATEEAEQRAMSLEQDHHRGHPKLAHHFDPSCRLCRERRRLDVRIGYGNRRAY